MIPVSCTIVTKVFFKLVIDHVLMTAIKLGPYCSWTGDHSGISPRSHSRVMAETSPLGDWVLLKSSV